MNTSNSCARLIRAVFSLGLIALFAMDVRAADAAAVAGVWEYKDPAVAVNSITFTLNPDGTGKVDDDAVTYTVVGNTIKVVTGGETSTYTFKIDGDTMTVSGGDLDKPTPFTRKNAAPKKGLGAKIKGLGTDSPKSETPKTDATNDQSSERAKSGGTAQGSVFDVVGKVAGSAPAAPAGLPGKWEASDGTVLEFSETTMVFNGNNIPYKAANGKISVTGGAGAIEWPYTVDGDKLTLTLEGVPQTLKRTGAAPAAAADAKAPAGDAKGAVGIWQAADGDQMEIRADALVYKGVTLPATLTAQSLKISANGQSFDCPYQVSGDSLNITLNGQPLALKRVGGGGAAAPAKKGADAGDAAKPAGDPAKAIVGTWESAEGSVVVRADGTVRSNGSEGRYQIDDQFITLSDDKQWVKIPYKLDGDKLVLGSGPSKTLTRSAGGPAGVYTVTESSLDPQFFMSITHYLSLYPDGSVGFEKSEGGASRTRIDENFVRFRSWKEKQGQAGKTYGRWTADANGGVTIQWQGAFKNATWQGRIDPKTGKLVLPHAGILNEGATLAYEKQ